MKKILITGMLCLGTMAFSQVGIGTPQPHESAILDLTSKNKGFLPPRLTTVQRDSIAVKPAGLMIYNTDDNCMQYWNTASWIGDCTDNPGLPGSISTLDCSTPTNTGSLVAGTAASGVSSSIPYTGGNGGSYNAQTVTSTGVAGLTATLAAGNFATGNGGLTYTITGTPVSAGTASFAITIGGQSCTFTRTVASAVGSISTLNCSGATHNGTLIAGNAASSVSSVISYTGGNGGSHSGQTVNSTGVTGLTAKLSAGSFANGSGSLTYTITGTPSGAGTASFAINIGGKTCTLTRTVSGPLIRLGQTGGMSPFRPSTDPFRYQMANTANYGPNGIYNKISGFSNNPTSIYPSDGETGAQLKAKYDIINISGLGYMINADATNRLKDFVNLGGVLLVTLDYQGSGGYFFDDFCNSFGITGTNSLGPTNTTATTSTTSTPSLIFGDTRGVSLNVVGKSIKVSKSRLPTGSTILATAADGSAAAWTIAGYGGRVIFIWAEGVYQSGNVAGNVIDTPQEKFLHNVLAYAIDKAKGY